MSNENNANDKFQLPHIPNGILFLVVFREGKNLRTIRQTDIKSVVEGIGVLDELVATCADLSKWLTEKYDIPTVSRTNVKDGFGA